MVTLYDFDGTLINEIAGNPSRYFAELESAQLTSLGKELVANQTPVTIATARPLFFKNAIRETCDRLGLNVVKILPLGSMFNNRREQGVRGMRKLSKPSRKALIAEMLDAVLVDNDEANLAALGERGIRFNEE